MLKESQSKSVVTAVSPEKVLAVKRQARISNVGFQSVNKLVKKTFGTSLSSKRVLDIARKILESIIEYRLNNLGDVALISIEQTMAERRKRLQLEDERGLDVVFSLDKGRGRVVSTVSLVHHPRPCSYYNHLPLQAWTGPDSHVALNEHDVGHLFRLLSSLGYRLFLGGDLSFLSTNFGLSCAMCFGCLWCNKRFIRGREAEGDKDSIDFTVYNDRSIPQVEEEIRKWKLAPPKAKRISIDRDRVIPPVLHAKIKIENVLYDRLDAIGGDLPEFQAILSQWKLKVNRHKEGIIYSRFHGNDIKRLCLAIDDLASNFLIFAFSYIF